MYAVSKDVLPIIRKGVFLYGSGSYEELDERRGRVFAALLTGIRMAKRSI
jgi:hypothetical protein